MSYLFKHLKRNCKQIFSFALAFIVFTEPSLQSYASTSLPVVFSSEESIDSYAESPDPDFDPKTYDGIPFYFDEDGNKVYDEENIYKDYVKPEYLGIAKTFEEYPLTTIDYSVDDISTYVVGIDDAALAVLAVTLATYGVYVGHEAIKDFASTNFEPWVRTKYGNDASVMENIQSWLAVKAGTAFAGMKLFSDVVGNFLKSGQVKDSTFTTGTRPIFSTTKYPPLMSIPAERYITSYEYFYGKTTAERGYLYLNGTPPQGYSLRALYSSSLDSYDAVYVKKNNSDVSITRITLYFNYVDYNKIEDYYVGSSHTDYQFKTYNRLFLIDHLNLPLFSNQQAMKSYFNYGTSGGKVNLPAYTLAPSTSIPLKKTWSGLLTNSSAYTRSNTMTIPSSSSAILDLLSKIYASDTEDEVIENVNSVWKVQKQTLKPSLSAEQSYSHLSYVLSAIAAYAGASVTSEQLDEFISSYYGNYVDGTSARKEEQAEEITDKFIVIDGGGSGGDPDNDDKDKNKYKIAKKLAAAFSAFMVSAAITKDLLDLEENPNIAANIQVETSPSIDSTPDSGTKPSSPNSGEDTNSKIDLSGVLSYLKNIVDILSKWANPNTLMDALVSKFDLGSIKSSILSLPSNIADTLGLQKLFDGLELPKLFSNTISSITALPDAIAQELGLPAQFENLGRIIELLPDKLVLGFASSFSGLESVVGALPNALAEILPGVLSSSLPNILSNTFGLVNGFSLPGVLSAIEAALGALPEALTDPLKAIQKAVEETPQKLADILKPIDETPEEKDDGNGLLKNIFDILMLLILIIIALLILFMNCLILILRLYQIPASTVLFNDNVLKGLEFLKSINIPFPGTTGIGLFELLMSCAYFVLFASVIATLRKRIDKFHV